MKIMLGVLALLMPVATLAQERGFYAGVDMGFAALPDDTRLQVNDVFLEDIASDEDGFTFGFTVGYRLSRHFAVEAGWVDLGNVTIGLADVSGANAAQGLVRYSAKGATGAVIGVLPFGSKWESTLKLGVFVPDYDMTLGGTAGSTSFSARLSTNKTRFFGGLSLRYRVTEQWHVKVGIDHYAKVGDRISTGGGQLTSQADITTVTLGIVFEF